MFGRPKRALQLYTTYVDLTEEYFKCGLCKIILFEDCPYHHLLVSGIVSCATTPKYGEGSLINFLANLRELRNGYTTHCDAVQHVVRWHPDYTPA